MTQPVVQNLPLPTDATLSVDAPAPGQHADQAALAAHADAVAQSEREVLEISLTSALELCRLGLGTMIDIRQKFEIELKGAIPGTVDVPLFDVKKMLGHPLSAQEQEALDCDEPADIDVRSFFTTFNQLHNERDHILLFVCNSGRRSLFAAHMMRKLGYAKALSVGGGFQAWKLLQAPQG